MNANRYVNLEFRFINYDPKDEDNVLKEITFSGHKGWQNFKFSKGVPTQKELEIITQMASLLNELAEIEEPKADYEHQPRPAGG